MSRPEIAPEDSSVVKTQGTLVVVSLVLALVSALFIGAAFHSWLVGIGVLCGLASVGTFTMVSNAMVNDVHFETLAKKLGIEL